MNEYQSPVYKVRAVPVEKVVANHYNPNVVAPPEMKLLELSIWEDGYTMPCVCYYLPDRDEYELVDGYHRYLVLKNSPRVYEREKGLLPVAVIEKDIANRMASTIRHNRARGIHNVELMSHIVAELTKAGMSADFRFGGIVCGQGFQYCRRGVNALSVGKVSACSFISVFLSGIVRGVSDFRRDCR